MSLIPHHATPPAGKGTDPLEKGPLKPFSNALMNLGPTERLLADESLCRHHRGCRRFRRGHRDDV